MSNQSVSVTALFFLVVMQGPVLADSNAVVDQCRNQSLDASGFNNCMELLEQESEAALSVAEAAWLETLQTVTEQVDVSQAGTASADWQETQEKLLVSGVSFQRYRDNHCGFLAAELDTATAPSRLIVCKTTMNRARADILKGLLVERKARAGFGNFYRGFYLPTQDGGIFQSCDLRQDWSLSADEDITARLAARYEQLTSDSLEMVYTELRGQLVESAQQAEPSTLVVSKLNLLRPILDRDCRHDWPAAATPANEAGTLDARNTLAVAGGNDFAAEVAGSVGAETSSAVAVDTTIDALGSAGFLYGYFGSWTSQCAAEMPRVCKAQTNDNSSTGGDWHLAIDRSADGSWRVRIIPTTDSHIIESQLQVSVDDLAFSTVAVANKQILTGTAQTLSRGEKALQLLNLIRNGNTLAVSWNSVGQPSSRVVFSLAGATVALNYFDTRVN